MRPSSIPILRYKIVYQLRWLVVILAISLIYICNLTLIKLPFISFSFPGLNTSKNVLEFLSNLIPKPNIEFYIYSIQTIVVWFLGAVLGSKLSLITITLYLLLGLSGLPIFAGGGGFDYFKEPTFGYLISLPLLAFLSGYFFEQNKKTRAIFIPIFTTHLLGILYLFLFQPYYLDLSWHLSFSMITYDLIFALILTPFLPLTSFFLNEMFIQEVPTRHVQ